MWDWIIANKQWVFDGFGVAVVIGFLSLLGRIFSANKNSNERASIVNNIGITNTVESLSTSATPVEKAGSAMKTEDQVRRIKDSTRILFVDDDEKFKVVRILRSSGWSNTTLTKDIASLDDPSVAETDIFFIDVQGVGVRLGFKDEGLGLAAALKEKYPQKRVVIYSAEPRGERFHKALRRADGALEKNADPYEFQQLVESFAGIS